jgi:hypothetical protein
MKNQSSEHLRRGFEILIGCKGRGRKAVALYGEREGVVFQELKIRGLWNIMGQDRKITWDPICGNTDQGGKRRE